MIGSRPIRSVSGFMGFLIGAAFVTLLFHVLYLYREKDLRVTLDEINIALKTCTELDYIEPFGKIVCKTVDNKE